MNLPNLINEANGHMVTAVTVTACLVTLASPNSLCTRKCKEMQAFFLHFSRFFVTLQSD